MRFLSVILLNVILVVSGIAQPPPPVICSPCSTSSSFPWPPSPGSGYILNCNASNIQYEIAATKFIGPALLNCSLSSSETIMVEYQNWGFDTLDFGNGSLHIRTKVVDENGIVDYDRYVTNGKLPFKQKDTLNVTGVDLSAEGWLGLTGTIQTSDSLNCNDQVGYSVFNMYQRSTPHYTDFTGFTGSNMRSLKLGWEESQWDNNNMIWPNNAWDLHTVNGNPRTYCAMPKNLGMLNVLMGPNLPIDTGDQFYFKLAITDTDNSSYVYLDYQDKVTLEYSLDCGSNWNVLRSFDRINGYPTTMTQTLVDISQFWGQEVAFRIVCNTGSNGNNPAFHVQVDDIYIGPVNFTLYQPFNGHEVVIRTDTNISLDFSWLSDTLINGLFQYEWMLDEDTGDFSNPILKSVSNANGTDTTFTLPQTVLDSILISRGLNIGQSDTFLWHVRAISASDTTYALFPFTIILTRDFKLHSPTPNSSFTIAGHHLNTIDFKWQSADANLPSPLFEWMIDYPTSPFVWPIMKDSSNNHGNDTIFSLSYAQMDSMLDDHGTGFGQTLQVNWSARAHFSNGDHADAIIPFRIDFIKGNVLYPVKLIDPYNGDDFKIDGYHNDFIWFKWTKDEILSGQVSYTMFLDSNDQFFKPVAQFSADSNGLDTNLLLHHSSIDSVLKTLNIAHNDTFKGYWHIRSTNGIDTAWAVEPFEILLIKKKVLYPFDLISPVDSAIVLLQGPWDTPYGFLWEQQDSGVTYELKIVDTNNFPFVSFNNLSSNDFIQNYHYFDSIMERRGYEIGDSMKLSWDVKSKYSFWDLNSSNGPFELTLVRGVLTQDFELWTPSDGAFIDLTANGGQSVTPFRWFEAQFNGDSGLTYAFFLDESNGDFSTPIMSRASNGNGLDELINIRGGELDTILFNYGLTDSGNVNTLWTVVTNLGYTAVMPFEVVLKKSKLYASVENQEVSDKLISVVPNPVNEEALIYLDATANKTYQLKMLNIHGQVVMEQNSIRQFPVIISRNQLESGIYFVELRSGEEVFQTKILLE